jgi:hypothetical protein
MEKIIARIPKLKGRRLISHSHELIKRSNEDGILLPHGLQDDKSNSLDEGTEPERAMESDELSNNDGNQKMSNQKDSNKALLIENYTEVLIQKLRLLDNNTKFRYYSSNGL